MKKQSLSLLKLIRAKSSCITKNSTRRTLKMHSIQKNREAWLFFSLFSCSLFIFYPIAVLPKFLSIYHILFFVSTLAERRWLRFFALLQYYMMCCKRSYLQEKLTMRFDLIVFSILAWALKVHVCMWKVLNRVCSIDSIATDREICWGC
jgi:hypothetical protein